MKAFSTFTCSNSTIQKYYTSMTKYLFKISNNNTLKKPVTAQINCSKSTMKTQNQDVKFITNVFTVNFEYISCFVLVFLLLTLNN